MEEYVTKQQVYEALGDDIGIFGRKALENLPAADVEPVIHARWIPCEDGFGCCCSNCHTGKCQLVDEFCAKCGARMDGE